MFRLTQVWLFVQVAYFISELKSAGNGSPGDATATPSLSSPAVPSPWSSPRKVESPHPVRDEYQCCKTVVLPGASCLFITFDPRCATQYEYDKVRQVLSLTFTDDLLVCLHRKRLCKEKDSWYGRGCEVWRHGQWSDWSTVFVTRSPNYFQVGLYRYRSSYLSLTSAIYNKNIDCSGAF